VWLNLSQNKFKVMLTSIGIMVGAATIMLVIAIGTGGREAVAEQFKNLNAGAIDISYEAAAVSSQSFMFAVPGSNGNMTIRAVPGSGSGGGGMRAGAPSFSAGSMGADNRMNQETVTLTTEDMEDLEVFVPGIFQATISYSTSASVEGGSMESAAYKTVAGVQSNYAAMSNLELSIGEFLTEENNESKERVCVLGSEIAKEIFGSAYDAYDAILYIDDRPYVVTGVLVEMGTVASGINPDPSVFIPYETGIKYIVGTTASPTITVIAEDVNQVATVTDNIKAVLADSYSNTEFTVSDAGSKMEAASASNDTLTLLLISMAVIVFLVGGIGIMNVLFVSVKERTNEIGILKAIGCSHKDILLEFLLEASCISFVGAVIGVLLSLGLTPVIEMFSVRVELSVSGAVLSLAFGVATGSLFGFYPAYKASRLIPVVALNQE
jgi:putative ABC transport system permease protein